MEVALNYMVTIIIASHPLPSFEENCMSSILLPWRTLFHSTIPFHHIPFHHSSPVIAIQNATMGCIKKIFLAHPTGLPFPHKIMSQWSTCNHWTGMVECVLQGESYCSCKGSGYYVSRHSSEPPCHQSLHSMCTTHM